MTSPDQSLENVHISARQSIDDASSVADLEQIRVRYLGKKGVVTEQLKRIGGLPGSERKQFGQEINEVKNRIAESIDSRSRELEALAETKNTKLMKRF